MGLQDATKQRERLPVGVIGAEEAEVLPLLEAVEVHDEVHRACFTYYRATYEGRPLVITRCGIGKVAAAVCSQILVGEFGVGSVIFTGIAGALDPSLRVGDIVISLDTVQHDFDASAFGRELGEVPPPGQRIVKADEGMVRLALSAVDDMAWPEGRPTVVVGRILTGDQFIADLEKVRWMRATFQGHVAEMEGAAVAQTCSWSNVPFVIVRSISDGADGDAKVSFETFIDMVGKRSAALVLGMIGRM